MMRLNATCIAMALALASTGVAAVELSGEQASELRERASRLLAERERNPGWDGGTRRLSAPQSEAAPDQSRGNVRMRSASGKRKREPVKARIKRAVKNLPGALVRQR